MSVLTSELCSQAMQADISAHEASLEDLRRTNTGNIPAPASDGKSTRGGTMLDHLQVRIISIRNVFLIISIYYIFLYFCFVFYTMLVYTVAIEMDITY